MKKCCWFIICLFAVHSMLAVTVVGVVTDDQLAPIAYASIYLQNNPKTGTISDNNGLFKLEIRDKNDIMTVSFIGYKNVTVPVRSLNLTDTIRLKLKEQPILLEDAIVWAKPPKYDRKTTKEILEKIRVQLNNDFPDIWRKYRVGSDVSIYNEGQVMAFDEWIGNIVEVPKKGKKGRDSQQMKTELTKFYINAEIDSGIKYFDTKLLKKKEKKALQNINFNNSTPVHKMFWALDIKMLFEDNYRETGRWNITEKGQKKWILTYTKTFNLPGIAKSEMKLLLTVDRQTYSVLNLSQSVNASANIPFGYKLSAAQLAALNLINLQEDDITKYRLKRINGTIQRNVLFKRENNQMDVAEKNWISNVNLSDKNNQEVKLHNKSTLKVISVQTSGVKAYSNAQLSQTAPRQIIHTSPLQ